MRIILSHIYNEEYLLPWWLEHHKKYFDYGIIVDYSSTDRSVEIIKSICPNWGVFPSRFAKFDSAHLEYELMFYMKQMPANAWIISLPVTEFLVGDIVGLTQDTSERKEWIIPTLVFAAYEPNGQLDQSKKLWEQVFTGRHYKDLASVNAWQCRNLHNFNDIFYMPGRHFSNENTDRAMIFKYANVLIGEQMIKRKLQIQHKISEEDKIIKRAAVTHISLHDDSLNENNLYSDQLKLVGEPYDCTKIMNSVLKYL